MARRFRSDHRNVDVFRQVERAEADVEAVREHQRLTLGKVRLDRVAVQSGLRGVRHQNHDHVRPRAGGSRLEHGESIRLRLRAGSARRGEPHPNLDTAVAQVERVGMPLRSISEHCHLAAFDQRQVRIRIVYIFAIISPPHRRSALSLVTPPRIRSPIASSRGPVAFSASQPPDPDRTGPRYASRSGPSPRPRSPPPPSAPPD